MEIIGEITLRILKAPLESMQWKIRKINKSQQTLTKNEPRWKSMQLLSFSGDHEYAKA